MGHIDNVLIWLELLSVTVFMTKQNDLSVIEQLQDKKVHLPKLQCVTVKSVYESLFSHCLHKMKMMQSIH